MPTGGRRGESAERAYIAHSAQIYRFLLRKTGNHHDAEELTQRVFADAAAALGPSGNEPRSLLSWLFAIAERRFVDEVRRRRSARQGLLLLRERDDTPDLSYSSEIVVAVKTAIGDLPECDRRIVVMKILEGRRFAEIAAELQLSEAACKMRLSRALAQVREQLSRQGIGPGGDGGA